MTINSIDFLLFFVVVFLIYYFPLKSKHRWQNVLLLLASYFFYGFADIRMLLLLMGVTVLYYFLGIGIGKRKATNGGRMLTTAGIVAGILLLLGFKYLNFFIASFSGLFSAMGLHTNRYSFAIILPLGISFFTFRLISYAIEVHRGTLEPTRNFISFATYVAFFPCLISGPIDRPQKFIPQLEGERPFHYQMAVDGLRQVLWGMFKKMVIADNLAIAVNSIWGDVAHQSGSNLLLGAVFYSFQIYADFSGYSDMAIGVAKILGFDVARNFNYPYFARNISEFWRHWHMSLTSWLMDYIYFPLGGSRCSKSTHFRNTMVVFIICGFWHGANWTFVLWGAYNGLLFLPSVIKKRKKISIVAAEGKLLPSLGELMNILGTFALVTLGWIMFRAETIQDGWNYMRHLFSGSLLSMPGNRALILYIVILVMVEWFSRTLEYPLQGLGKIKYAPVRWALYYVLIFIIMKYQGEATQFVYFKF